MPEQQQQTQTNPTLTPPIQSQNSTGEGDFVKMLPEDLRSHPSAAKFKDAGALFRSYTELEKGMGNRIRVPGDDAKPEDWSDFYSKIGRPESPDKYGLKRPELPEGVPWPEETEKAFAGVAHQLGLTPKQAQGLMDWFGGDIKANIERTTQGRAAAAESLKKDWGTDYDKNLGLAQRAFSDLLEGDKDPIIDFMRETGAHEDPRVLKFFARLGKLMDEDGSAAFSDRAPAGGEGREAAMSKIAEMRNNKSHPYHNPNMAGHKEAIAEMSRLYALAYPDA